MIKEALSQWVADNVDHDINTLTGKGTFHGMGIICAIVVGKDTMTSDDEDDYLNNIFDILSDIKIK